MNWIKASDRLPDTRVIVRWVSPAGGPYIEIGDGDWIKGYKTAGHYAPDSLEEVEWLDESTPSPSRRFTVEEIRDAYISGCNAGLQFDGKTLIQNANEYIASLPLQSKVEGDDWVGADTPPENERAVIVVGKFGKVLQTLNDMAYYKNGKWYDNANDWDLVPTFIKYWKDKPAPPKQ